MKHVFLTASLLLATLSVLPAASADAVDPCDQQAGYEQCDADVGPCRVDGRYYQHDAFLTVGAGCLLGNAHCGYYSHGVYGYWTGFDCEYIGPVAASAPALPVQCHGPLDGQQSCEVQQGTCHAGEDYDTGDVHAHAECQPTDGKSRCGVDVYASPLVITRHCRGNEEQVWPVHVASASAAPPCSLDHDVYPGYVNVDLACDPLVNCHINNVEDSTRTCESGTLGCAADGLGLRTGTQYAVCHDDACAASPTAALGDLDRCVLPGAAPATTAASGTSGTGCQQYPGYERCDHTVGPCTVTTTHYYHDAHYTVEVCGLVIINPPGAASTTAASGTGCQQYPGYERCDYSVGPCTVTMFYYYHDAFYVVEGPTCGKPSVATASADGRECQAYPGYTDCVHTVGPCSVTTRWYHHDAFYVVYGPDCEKPSVATAASSPLSCGGTDGRVECEAVAGPCHAGFHYQRPEVEDVHAQCF